jgi:beta-N-acetylhexosaminidase
VIGLDLSVSELCGQLLVGGFAGPELPPSYAHELSRGHRAGAILFRRNLHDVEQILQLNRAVIEASGKGRPPLIGLDQEGGRVTRLPAPFTKLPPMRLLGELDDLDLTGAAAAQIGAELSAVGFNLDFAPVLDVDSNPDNPVIGDRSFGRDPSLVGRHGCAFIRALQARNVLACGKHFPGHGDTRLDSHLELPRVDQPLERLERVELMPFRAAADAGVAAMMTAHVVFEALDPGVPATFSPAIVTDLLRRDLGFERLLFSDDLEMGAIANRHAIEEAAVAAVAAGCDVLLICSDEEQAVRAHEALVREAERDSRFRHRCEEAATRSLRQRRLCPPRIEGDDVIASVVGGERAQELLRYLEGLREAGPVSSGRAP